MAAFMLVELLSDAPDDLENWRIAKSLAIIIAAFQAQLPPRCDVFQLRDSSKLWVSCEEG
jgi:hypothetical protein